MRSSTPKIRPAEMDQLLMVSFQSFVFSRLAGITTPATAGRKKSEDDILYSLYFRRQWHTRRCYAGTQKYGAPTNEGDCGQVSQPSIEIAAGDGPPSHGGPAPRNPV